MLVFARRFTRLLAAAGSVSAVVGALACRAPAPAGEAAVEPGVSWELASERFERVRDLRYALALDIPSDRAEPITGRLEASFDLAVADRPLWLDFAQPAGQVSELVVNGAEVAAIRGPEHFGIPADALAAGPNTVAIAFVAGDESLNRNDDFLYTLFVPDRARFAVPLFDQPNLKARLRLELEVPAEWQAVANGPLEERLVSGNRAVYTFAETEPIATYVLAFAAGRFEIESAERGGRTLRLFHRETDHDTVARNLEAIFDLHAAALAWLERYTGIAYPFQKLDFVAVPAFQYGGMEHPGAIFYRDRGLFLDESATRTQVLGRASVIAHETAHMWFGNLVTMEWFDDVWMKEVFANFMAAKIVEPSFPEIDHELRFLLAHYPRAYAVDRTDGANPIRQPLENLNQAGSLYGAIIYQKAPIAMKQLERLMGEGAFRQGLRRYLGENRYANASWPDLVAALDPLTEEDLAAWSEVWIDQPGRPEIRTETEIEDGVVRQLRLVQRDPADRGRRWNQRLEVAVGETDGSVRRVPVHLRDESAPVPELAGAPAPAFVLANGAGVGYGAFVLDPASQRYLVEHLQDLDEPLLRSVAWLALWDAMLDGRLEARALLALARRALAVEESELVAERLLSDLETLFWRFSSAAEREASAPALERLLWRRLEAAAETTRKAAFFETYRDTALTAEAVAHLGRIRSGAEAVPGLPLSESDRIALALQIAVRDLDAGRRVLDEEEARIENPDRLARFRFVRRALAPEESERERFFTELLEPANRAHEPWVLEALRLLHHPLHAEGARRFLEPALEELEEIQRTGDIFFPLGWLEATLGGHRAPEAAAIVRDFLDRRTDLEPRLRGKLLQAADPLFRAAALGEE